MMTNYFFLQTASLTQQNRYIDVLLRNILDLLQSLYNYNHTNETVEGDWCFIRSFFTMPISDFRTTEASIASFVYTESIVLLK